MSGCYLMVLFISLWRVPVAPEVPTFLAYLSNFRALRLYSSFVTSPLFGGWAASALRPCGESLGCPLLAPVQCQPAFWDLVPALPPIHPSWAGGCGLVDFVLCTPVDWGPPLSTGVLPLPGFTPPVEPLLGVCVRG